MSGGASRSRRFDAGRAGASLPGRYGKGAATRSRLSRGLQVCKGSDKSDAYRFLILFMKHQREAKCLILWFHFCAPKDACVIMLCIPTWELATHMGYNGTHRARASNLLNPMQMYPTKADAVRCIGGIQREGTSCRTRYGSIGKIVPQKTTENCCRSIWWRCAKLLFRLDKGHDAQGYLSDLFQPIFARAIAGLESTP